MDRYQLTNEHRAIKSEDGKWCKVSDMEEFFAENSEKATEIVELSAEVERLKKGIYTIANYATDNLLLVADKGES